MTDELLSREGVWVKFSFCLGVYVSTLLKGFLAYLNLFSKYLPNRIKLRGTTTTPTTIKTIVKVDMCVVVSLVLFVLF